MQNIDKLKGLIGSSPYAADITKFLHNEITGNNVANQSLTNNTALLESIQRNGNVKLRDAVTGVFVQDAAGVITRQSVLTQTVSELVGLENRIVIADLNKTQDEKIARLGQTNKYDVANLQGELKKELAGVDGEIDLELAGVSAESKALLATETGKAEHDGKVDIERQVSLNNIELAKIDSINTIKLGTLRADNLVKMAIIDAAVISAESVIDVAGVTSASAITVTGIALESKHDADVIALQATNEVTLKTVATTHEVVNLTSLSQLDVALTNVMATSEKGATEISTATETKSIGALANGEALSISSLALASKLAIESNATLETTFERTSSKNQATALTSTATTRKINAITEANAEVTYLSGKGELQRAAITSDFTLSDTLSKSLSDVEISNTKALSTEEVTQIGTTSGDKIKAMGNENTAQKGYIKDISDIESGEKGSIRTNANTRYDFVKARADDDAKNSNDLFTNVEKVRRETISGLLLQGDKDYSISRIGKQATIDGIETSEISSIAASNTASQIRIAGIDTTSIGELAGIDIGSIEASATQRDGFIRSQSKTRRDNDANLSNNVTIPSIKALSSLKIKEYGDRLAVEKTADSKITPERLRVINAERDLRVTSIGTDATARDKSARAEADRETTAQTTDATTRTSLTTNYQNYVNRIKVQAHLDASMLSKEAAYYAANSTHREVVFSNGDAPKADSYSGAYIENSVVETPPDFK